MLREKILRLLSCVLATSVLLTSIPVDLLASTAGEINTESTDSEMSSTETEKSNTETESITGTESVIKEVCSTEIPLEEEKEETVGQPKEQDTKATEVVKVNSLESFIDAVNATTGEDVLAPAYEFSENSESYLIEGKEQKSTTTITGEGKDTLVSPDVFKKDDKVSTEVFSEGEKSVTLEKIVESSDYEVISKENSTCLINPYQNKRLVVFSEIEFDAKNAIQIIQGYKGIFVLTYDSEEATKAAYEYLCTVPNISVEVDTVFECNSMSVADTTAVDTSVPEEKAGKNITVAVIDSGYENEEADRILPGANLSSSTISYDMNGHGTMMANIILDHTNDSVNVMPIKVTDEEGRTSALRMYSAIQSAITAKIDVINISMSAYKSTNAILVANAVQDAVNANIPVIVAAGNLGEDVVNYSPANEESAITVSAVNKDKTRAEYSNYGRFVDYSSYGSLSVLGLGGKRFTVTGTSVTAAIVSALCAETFSTSKATFDTLNVYLQEKAEDLGSTGRDDDFGYGMLSLEGFSTSEDDTLLEEVEKSKLELLQCDWKALSDKDFDKILEVAPEAVMSKFLKDLSDSDLKELLSRETMLTKPRSALVNITSDETTCKSKEFKRYYDYLIDNEYVINSVAASVRASGRFTVGFSTGEAKTYPVKVTSSGVAGDTYTMTWADDSTVTAKKGSGTKEVPHIWFDKAKEELSGAAGDQNKIYIATNVYVSTGEDHCLVNKDTVKIVDGSSETDPASSGWTDGFGKCTAGGSRDLGLQVRLDEAGIGGSGNMRALLKISDEKINKGSWSSWKDAPAATCTTGGVQVRTRTDKCTTCDKSYTKQQSQVTAALDHSYVAGAWGGWVTTVNPTCLAEGASVRTRTDTCSRCSAQTTASENASITPLGHGWPGAWSYADNNGVAQGEAYKNCSRCSVRLANEYKQYVGYRLMDEDGNYPGFYTTVVSSGYYAPGTQISGCSFGDTSGVSDFVASSVATYAVGAAANEFRLNVPRKVRAVTFQNVLINPSSTFPPFSNSGTKNYYCGKTLNGESLSTVIDSGGRLEYKYTENLKVSALGANVVRRFYKVVGPTIAIGASSNIAKMGEKVTFTVVGTNPANTFQWYTKTADGVERALTGATKDSYSIVVDASTQGREYWCISTNSYTALNGEVVAVNTSSNRQKVTVQYKITCLDEVRDSDSGKDKTRLGQLQEQYITYDQPVRGSSFGTDSQDTHYEFVADTQIDNVVKDDTVIRYFREKTPTVDVKVSPRSDVFVGDEVTFTASAKNNFSQYQWYYESPEVEEDGTKNVRAIEGANESTYKVTVDSAKDYNQCRIFCEVKNVTKTATDGITLSVYDMPSQPTSPTVMSEGKVLSSVQYAKEPVTFTFNNSTIEGAGRIGYQYKFGDAEWKDIASDQVGDSTWSVAYEDSDGDTSQKEIFVRAYNTGYRENIYPDDSRKVFTLKYDATFPNHLSLAIDHTKTTPASKTLFASASDSTSGVVKYAISQDYKENPSNLVFQERNTFQVKQSGIWYLYVLDAAGNIAGPQTSASTDIDSVFVTFDIEQPSIGSGTESVLQGNTSSITLSNVEDHGAGFVKYYMQYSKVLDFTIVADINSQWKNLASASNITWLPKKGEVNIADIDKNGFYYIALMDSDNKISNTVVVAVTNVHELATMLQVECPVVTIGEKTTFTFSNDGEVSSYDISLKDPSFAKLDDVKHTLTGLKPGKVTLVITGINYDGSKVTGDTEVNVINTPPVIKENPVDSKQVPGESVTFNVNAKGTNNEFQWYRSIAKDVAGNEIRNANDATFTLESVSSSDNNTYYYCVVSNEGNTIVTSESAKLTVLEQPSVPKITPDRKSNWYNAPVTFTVDGSVSKDGVVYQYSLDGTTWNEYSETDKIIWKEEGAGTTLYARACNAEEDTFVSETTTFTVCYDATVPVIDTIDFPGSWVVSGTNLTVTAHDAWSGVAFYAITPVTSTRSGIFRTTEVKEVEEPQESQWSNSNVFSLEHTGMYYVWIMDLAGNVTRSTLPVVINIDDNDPDGYISCPNTVTSEQPVTLTLSDVGAGVSSYYWGTTAPNEDTEYKSTISSKIRTTVSEPGIYYLSVKDKADNVSRAVSKAFYRTTLDSNGGTSTYTDTVLTMLGNNFTPMDPKRKDHVLIGWNTDPKAETGTFIIVPKANATYYAIWRAYELCGDNAGWFLDSENVLHVTGTGTINDTKPGEAPWSTLVDKILAVEVEEGITGIGANAFSGLYNVTTIKLPKTLTSIGDSAFSQTAVVNVKLPDSVTNIGAKVFQNCTELTQVILPHYVNSIENGTFEGCKSLVSLDIPSSVEWISDTALDGCISITKINLPADSRIIHDSAKISKNLFDSASRITCVEVVNNKFSTDILKWITDVDFSAKVNYSVPTEEMQKVLQEWLRKLGLQGDDVNVSVDDKLDSGSSSEGGSTNPGTGPFYPEFDQSVLEKILNDYLNKYFTEVGITGLDVNSIIAKIIAGLTQEGVANPAFSFDAIKKHLEEIIRAQLAGSGLSEEEINNIIKTLLDKITGNVVNSDLKDLLTAILKDLGFSDSDIQSWVSEITKIINAAKPGSEGYDPDALCEKLKEFFDGLGLSSEQVSKILDIIFKNINSSLDGNVDLWKDKLSEILKSLGLSANEIKDVLDKIQGQLTGAGITTGVDMKAVKDIISKWLGTLGIIGKSAEDILKDLMDKIEASNPGDFWFDGDALKELLENYLASHDVSNGSDYTTIDKILREIIDRIIVSTGDFDKENLKEILKQYLSANGLDSSKITQIIDSILEKIVEAQPGTTEFDRDKLISILKEYLASESISKEMVTSIIEKVLESIQTSTSEFDKEGMKDVIQKLLESMGITGDTQNSIINKIFEIINSTNPGTEGFDQKKLESLLKEYLREEIIAGGSIDSLIESILKQISANGGYDKDSLKEVLKEMLCNLGFESSKVQEIMEKLMELISGSGVGTPEFSESKLQEIIEKYLKSLGISSTDINKIIDKIVNNIASIGSVDALKEFLKEYLTSLGLTPSQVESIIKSILDGMGGSGGNVSGGDSNTTVGRWITVKATPFIGYHFVKWVDSYGSSLGNANPLRWQVLADSSVYAVFEPNEYKVLFDANGGKCTYESKQVLFAEKYGELPVPTRTGYTFEGWHSLGRAIKQDTQFSELHDTTLVASWVKEATPTPTPVPTPPPTPPPTSTPPQAPTPAPTPAPEVVLTKAACDLKTPSKTISKTLGGKPFKLGASCTTGGITYVSSNTKIATIDGSGKVKIKGVGIATIVISVPESATHVGAVKSVNITIQPKGVSLNSAQNKAAKAIALKWKVNKSCTGYQVQYTTDKKFKKSNKTKTVKCYTTKKVKVKGKTKKQKVYYSSVTLKKLKKGKTYYTRVRTYKTVKNKKIYSGWSKVKKVKIKK